MTKNEKLVAEARLNLEAAEAHDSENRDKAADDLRFAFSGDPEDQWDQAAWKARSNRPRLTYNRVEPALDQMIGDQRQNRPQIKLRATEDGDTDTTETFAGLIRNIESQSNAETVYDHAYMYAAACGVGAWQVVPEYVTEDSFDQDLRIRAIHNPFAVHFDPSAQESTKEDAMWCLVSDWISKAAFEAKYPGKSCDDFEGGKADWNSKDKGVRIADYWKKIPKKRTLLELSDGRILFKDDVSNILDELEGQGITVKREREVDSYKVSWCKISGSDVLEGPIEYDWRYIPVIPLYGKRFNIEGKEVYKGIVRNAKDPQRSLNYSRSSLLEVAALSPKAPYLLTPGQIKGHEGVWNQAHRENRTWLPYNPDERAPGKPFREQSPGIPPELIQLAQLDAEDIKAVTGRYDASLGATSNETSGRAILARQREGDVGSFVFTDNLSKSIAHTGRVLIDMIPKIYDTERQIRILGEDGSEKFVSLNQTVVDEEGNEKLVNDTSVGKYDVTVTVGPSYTTQRQEASERLLQLAGITPEILQIAGDIVVKGLDIPDQDELVSRLRRRMIMAGAIEPGQDEDEQALVQQGPTPEQQAQQELVMRQLIAQVTKEESDAAIAAGEADRQPLEAEKLLQEIIETQVNARVKAVEAGLKALQPPRA